MCAAAVAVMVALALGLVLGLAGCSVVEQQPGAARSSGSVADSAPDSAPGSAPDSVAGSETDSDSDSAPAPVPEPADPPAARQYPPVDVPGTLALLNTLEVKGRAPKTGYSRDEFGQRWKDIDRNGCDQRNDVLARDLTDVNAPEGCKVLSGVLQDPYTGETIDFRRGAKTSSAVQIDHVVALGDAWQKGAQQLSPEQREEIGNDTMNLLAVDGPTNQAKGAGDAATWLPPNKAFRCQYVTIQTQVKAKYHLWVTQAEKDAIERVLSTCGA
ncbi:DUF1524 domain-containing protein [Corynebacterium falsenii]|uniref:GmrSD restriction endonuclease domain-containing protein n=1 Tax=Corynebacterium falsenii TaxID=108486 RepID=UPI0004B85F43